jgi:hypothetical protein
MGVRTVWIGSAVRRETGVIIDHSVPIVVDPVLALRIFSTRIWLAAARITLPGR